MNLLNKLTIKNLKLNRKRTVVTIIGIILSVALITAVAAMYTSALQSLINYEIKEDGDFHVAYYDVPATDIPVFENNRNIDTINLTQNIGYAEIDSQNEYKPYAYIKAFTKNALENLSVSLVEGRLPENSGEIVIPTHLKTNGRVELNVGDTITLDVGKRVDGEGYELTQNNPVTYSEGEDAQTGESEDSGYIEKRNEKIVDTTKREYKIVGIIERPAANVEGYFAPGYTFITYISEDDISGTVDLYAKYTKEGVKNTYKVTAGILEIDASALEKYYSDSFYGPENDDVMYEIEQARYTFDINKYLVGLETNPLGISAVGSLSVVAGIIVGIIVITSVFCIKNSFDISITEKIRQYGMLRSVGATKRQIRKNVFYEASILGAFGIPLGIIFGFLASWILVMVSNYYLKEGVGVGFDLEFSFSYVAAALAVLLGIVTIYFSAFRSAGRASAVSPIDSIRNSADIKINPKKIKSPKIIKKLFGMGGEISYKNLKRNKKKYRTTVISIVVSVFVFIALSSFMTMAFDVVENEIDLSESNILLSASYYNDETYEKLIETTNLDTVENYTILRQDADFAVKENIYNQEYIDWLELELDSEMDNYVTIMALGNEQYEKYIESLNLDSEEIKDKVIICDYSVISRYNEEQNEFENKYMRIYELEAGDVVHGVFEKGTENEREYDLEISVVTEERPFAMKNYNGPILVVSDELFDRMTTSEYLEIYYKSTDADKLQDEIDKLLEGEDYSVNNYDEQARSMNNLYTLIGIFLYGFIIVISLIGITNIFNTITTNMQLRRQEFAMLKSVGMTGREFNRMIRLESLFMGVKSLIIGIPIGVLLSYVIYHFLVSEMGLPYKLPLMAITISVIIVFILIWIIMRYSIHKINRQNIIETIRNENI